MFVFGAQTAKSTQLARKIWAGTDPVGRILLEGRQVNQTRGIAEIESGSQAGGGAGWGKALRHVALFSFL